MPMPRPAMCVTVSLVEKPGSKVSWMVCSSSTDSADSIIPRCSAIERILARSYPPPSSRQRTTTFSPSREKLSTIRPSSSLPRSSRSSGASIP